MVLKPNDIVGLDVGYRWVKAVNAALTQRDIPIGRPSTDSGRGEPG
ncbi:MAG: hypothetical protein RPU39_15625 [Candidatus Sedimenticola sp. (ex Thyasira tokunagai)]